MLPDARCIDSDEGVRERAIPPIRLFHPSRLIHNPHPDFDEIGSTDPYFAAESRAADRAEEITEGFDTLVKLPQINFDPHAILSHSLKETVVARLSFFVPSPSIHHSSNQLLLERRFCPKHRQVVQRRRKLRLSSRTQPSLVTSSSISRHRNRWLQDLTEGEQVAYELFTDDKGAKARKVQSSGVSSASDPLRRAAAALPEPRAHGPMGSASRPSRGHLAALTAIDFPTPDGSS